MTLAVRLPALVVVRVLPAVRRLQVRVRRRRCLWDRVEGRIVGGVSEAGSPGSRGLTFLRRWYLVAAASCK